jgi:hypothetical protein
MLGRRFTAGEGVKMTGLSKVERAVLNILASHQGEEVAGRELRTALQNRGFRRSAPAFVFTMMNLADKGLVSCREEVEVFDSVEARHRFYRATEA